MPVIAFRSQHCLFAIDEFQFGLSIIFFTESHKVHIRVSVGIEFDPGIHNVVKLDYCC